MRYPIRVVVSKAGRSRWGCDRSGSSTWIVNERLNRVAALCDGKQLVASGQIITIGVDYAVQRFRLSVAVSIVGVRA